MTTDPTPSPNRSDRSNRSNRSVLDDVLAWLERYIVTPSPSDLHVLALWAAHTWLADVLPSTPRLLIDSIAPGSGKSTTLEHLGKLSRDSCHMSTISSPALLVRMLDERPRTLLLDEIDRALDPRGDMTKEILSVLNSGYRPGATRPVLVPGKGGEWMTREMPTYAPVAMAGNSPRLPDDTRSRTIRMVLMPDVAGLAEESDWEDIDTSVRELRDRLESWADGHRDEVRASRPDLPAGVKGRNRERWAPLMRVAIAAGGEWPERVRDLIAGDLEEQRLIAEEGLQRIPPAVQLVIDIRLVFDATDEEFVPTRDLVNYLIGRHPDMWGAASDFGRDLTAQRLGRMLTQTWRIHSRQRPDGDRARGYLRADFAAAWRQVDGMIPNGSHGSNSSNGSPERGTDGAARFIPTTPAKEYAA